MTSLVKSQNTVSKTKNILEGLKGLKVEKEEKRRKEQKKDTVFLLDVSGSMSEYTKEGMRKIDSLRLLIQEYPENRKISFSANIWENKIPEPQTNTDMALGFRHIKTLFPKPTVVVLVSDGLPDSQDDAIQEAISLKIPINIAYIGKKEESGEVFMKKLASITRGKEFTLEPTAPQFNKQLKQAIAGLITDGS